MASMRALKPLQDTIIDAMNAAHKNIVGECTRLHSLLVTSDSRLQSAMAHCATLQADCQRLTAERNAAIALGEQLKAEKKAAIEDMQKINTNLPKLLAEYFELKSDHALLQRKMAMLEEENAQLREKARVEPTSVPNYESMFAAPSSPLEQKVKVEASPLAVKQERSNATDSPSSDPDTVFAAGEFRAVV